MDMDIRTNSRPQPPIAHPHPVSNPAPPPHTPRSYRMWRIATPVAIIAVICLVVGGICWWQSQSSSSEGAIMPDRYQAVFLSDGQVYFGHLKNVDNGYVVMSGVYYLKVQSSDTSPKQTMQQLPQQASLSKLGGEVHGPEDTMYIAHSQIVYWENLKTDSKVVQAIKNQQK